MVAQSPGNTAVLENYTSSKPSAFTLKQNYPNPFNSDTIIRFAVPNNQHTELAIYNLVGQKVVTLLKDFRPAGSYTINWDGRDGQQRPLASGIYLYRLQAGTQVDIQKLTLLR